MPQLVITKGQDKGRVLRLKKEDTTTLGRGDVTHRIDDEHISRRHVRVFRHNSRWYVADLDSMNGTFVNGERIEEPVKLRDGDVVRIGHTKMVVEKSSSRNEKSAAKSDSGEAIESAQEEKVIEQAVKPKKKKKEKKAVKQPIPDDGDSGAESLMLADIRGDFDMGDEDGEEMDPFEDFDFLDEDDEVEDDDDINAAMDKKTEALPDDEKTVLETGDEEKD